MRRGMLYAKNSERMVILLPSAFPHSFRRRVEVLRRRPRFGIRSRFPSRCGPLPCHSRGRSCHLFCRHSHHHFHRWSGHHSDCRSFISRARFSHDKTYKHANEARSAHERNIIRLLSSAFLKRMITYLEHVLPLVLITYMLGNSEIFQVRTAFDKFEDRFNGELDFEWNDQRERISR